jgi:hypothetical protein
MSECAEYTTVPKVKIQAGIDRDDTSQDAWIQSLIEPVSRAIDEHCHRWFYARTLTIPWDYQDPWKLMLWGRDLLSITTLTNGNGTAFSAGQYFLYPTFGPPYRWIEIARNRGVLFNWSGTPQQAISIAGTWGYLEDGETPTRIQYAAAAWLSYLLKEGPDAGVRSKTIGDFSVSFGSLDEQLKEPPGEVKNALGKFIMRDYQAVSPPQYDAEADAQWFALNRTPWE